MPICIIKTPLGIAKIVGSATGISEVRIINQDEYKSDFIPSGLEEAAIQLKQYFDGARKTFDLNLNPLGTNFQKLVWQNLVQIPYGHTVSYKELSKKIGNVNAARAVANANGKNPIWIIIPCHRIIGSNGSLTGYAGGLHRKQWLMEHESLYDQQLLFQ